MATKVADTERKEVESAVRNAVRDGGFLCPECSRRVDNFVVNAIYGPVCAVCDAVIKLSE